MDQEHAERESARPCEQCQGKGCEPCGGSGWVTAESKGKDEPGSGRTLAEMWPYVSELVAAMLAMESESTGVAGFVAAARAAGETRRLHPEAMRWIGIMRGELAKLEFEDDIQDALAESRRR